MQYTGIGFTRDSNNGQTIRTNSTNRVRSKASLKDSLTTNNYYYLCPLNKWKMSFFLSRWKMEYILEPDWLNRYTCKTLVIEFKNKIGNYRIIYFFILITLTTWTTNSTTAWSTTVLILLHIDHTFVLDLTWKKTLRVEFFWFRRAYCRHLSCSVLQLLLLKRCPLGVMEIFIYLL